MNRTLALISLLSIVSTPAFAQETDEEFARHLEKPGITLACRTAIAEYRQYAASLDAKAADLTPEIVTAAKGHARDEALAICR